MANSKIPVLLLGEGSLGLGWEAAEVIPWFIQILSGCSRPRQKTSLLFSMWQNSLEVFKQFYQNWFGGLLSLLGSLSHLICLEDHLGWPVGGGLYSNCIPDSSQRGVQGCLSRKADLTCDTLWLAKKSTPACSLQQTLLALHPLQSPLLTCLLAAQQRFFNLANVTALVRARET